MQNENPSVHNETGTSRASVLLKEGERLDDLQYKGLFIIQNPDLFCFGTDAVLLSAFVSVHRGQTVVDLGAGTGILSILAGARTGAQFTAVEIQEPLCDMARRSMQYNALPFPVHCLDWAQAPKTLGHCTFDAAVCNPPYFSAGFQSQNPARAISRHTNGETLLSVCKAAQQLVKFGGKFFVVYPMGELIELICTLRTCQFEPKRMQLVAYRADMKPRLALIEAKKGAKPGLIMEPLLCHTDHNGDETPQMRAVYHRDEYEQVHPNA